MSRISGTESTPLDATEMARSAPAPEGHTVTLADVRWFLLATLGLSSTLGVEIDQTGPFSYTWSTPDARGTAGVVGNRIVLWAT